MNISYLVTCSDETKTLRNLLIRLINFKEVDDEIVIVLDSDCKNNEETKSIITNNSLTYLEHSLSNCYSDHKNWGAKQCKNKFIFQIDGDELPTETLLLNIKDIISVNSNIEAFWIPRINDFRGVNESHAKKWGWRLSLSKSYNRLIVNWPDFQCRCFMNKPEIQWIGNLHERISGNKNYVYLPDDEELSLYHDKTIEKQILTNLKYNTVFTKEENQGFTLPK